MSALTQALCVHSYQPRIVLGDGWVLAHHEKGVGLGPRYLGCNLSLAFDQQSNEALHVDRDYLALTT